MYVYIHIYIYISRFPKMVILPVPPYVLCSDFHEIKQPALGGTPFLNSRNIRILINHLALYNPIPVSILSSISYIRYVPTDHCHSKKKQTIIKHPVSRIFASRWDWGSQDPMIPVAP